MSKILFANAFFYKLDPKQWEMQEPYPPLGTLYAAALMRKQHEVSLFDSNLSDSPDELEEKLKVIQPDYLVIYDDGFNYLTKMCLTVMREAAFSMAKLGKKYGCTVLISSSDSSDHYENYLKEGVDFVLIGEAEFSLQQVIDSLENKERNFDLIDGIAFKLNDSKLKKTTRRAVINTLDDLPRPAWDLVDMEAYRAVWLAKHGYFSLNIGTTRGCPFKCNWCAKPIYGNRYNSHSPKRVVEDIAFLLENYQPDHFWMCDDIFGLKPGWVQEFNTIVQARSLKFSYKIQSRADLLLAADNIKALAESGLETVWIGAESGSQRILDAMDKGTTLEQIHSATSLLKKHGIKVAFFLQFGYLGEENTDIKKTARMVKQLVPDYIGVSVSYPLPGTKFYEKVKGDLSLKANWSDSDDLDMMFHNTYAPNYYRKLHRYIHQVHRKARAQKMLSNTLIPVSMRAKQLLKIPYHTLGEWYYAIQMLQYQKPAHQLKQH